MNKQETVYLKKWARITVCVILAFGLLLSLYLFLLSTNTLKKEANEIFYSYTVDNKVDYNVNLYENSFIDKTTLGPGESYISDLVKNIDTNFNYTYQGSKVINLKYTYSVKAIVNAKYSMENTDESIMKKEYILVPEKEEKTNNSTNININEKVKIDYRFYENVISEFRKELKIPVNATLDVICDVNIKGHGEDYKVNENKELKLSLPLNKQAFKIDTTTSEKINKNIGNESDINAKINAKVLIWANIVLYIDLILFFFTYRDLLHIKKTNYNFKLSKIMKEYGNIIVEIVDPIDKDDYEIIKVKNFNELIDLEEEIRSPINFYEIKKGYKAELFIIKDSIYYEYILDNNERKL